MQVKSGSSRLFPTVCVAIAALILPQEAVAQDEEASQRTVGQVTVYGWLAGFGGDIRPGADAPTFRVDKSFGELFEDSDGAFFATGLVRHDRLVLIADFSSTSSSKEAEVPTGIPQLPVVPAEGRLKQTSFTAAGGYRVVDNGQTTVDLLGGARAWWVKGDVEVSALSVSRDRSVSFVDPIIAARANFSLSPRLRALFYGDIGGLGVGSQFTAQAVGTLNFRVGRRFWLSGGYRYLVVDYKKNGVRVDAALGGPLVGATVTF